MTREILSDGRVAISFEDRGGAVRLFDCVPSGLMPKYVAVGDVTRLSPTICKLSAFAGRMLPAHSTLLAQLLAEQGYSIVYVERAAGKGFPGGVLIEEGDWAGWWRVDLPGLMRRRAGQAAVRRRQDHLPPGNTTDACRRRAQRR